MEPPVIAGIITASVGLVTLIVSGLLTRASLAAARSTEAWKRFQWGLEQVTDADVPEARREAALVVMGEVQKSRSTSARDKAMMVDIQTKLTAQPAPAKKTGRFGR